MISVYIKAEGEIYKIKIGKAYGNPNIIIVKGHTTAMEYLANLKEVLGETEFVFDEEYWDR